VWSLLPPPPDPSTASGERAVMALLLNEEPMPGPIP
jgi:hypothetical protein